MFPSAISFCLSIVTNGFGEIAETCAILGNNKMFTQSRFSKTNFCPSLFLQAHPFSTHEKSRRHSRAKDKRSGVEND